MTAAKEDVTYQNGSPLGSETVRANLRSALMDHLHSQAPYSFLGFHRWTAPSAKNQAAGSGKLLVGDPIVLAENLKILKQYSKLLSQACALASQGPDPLLPAHAQPLSSRPTSYPRNLQWFETLSAPYEGLDAAGTERITQLLQLHAACDKSAPRSPREQAYELAKSLPHFDRDLTAYFLTPPASAREYDLHVAHSIMRLHDPATLEELHQRLPAWRNQGLLHVLSVAASHMPALADWFPVDTPSEDQDEEARSLQLTLEALRAHPRDYGRIISDFIATQRPASPTAQAIATTLDKLAILMSVKSNASTEPEHDLSTSLALFPRLESLEPHDLWCRIKPALEQALPPSLLRVDPGSSCIRKRVRKHKPCSPSGSWYAPHTRPLLSAIMCRLCSTPCSMPAMIRERFRTLPTYPASHPHCVTAQAYSSIAMRRSKRATVSPCSDPSTSLPATLASASSIFSTAISTTTSMPFLRPVSRKALAISSVSLAISAVA